jgi:integrase-like protein
VLGACLQAAIYYRFADSNPVRKLPPAQRPPPERKKAAYFENDELPRLFEHLKTEPYRMLCLTALKTGMRQGELLALRWGDVDLAHAVVRVRQSFTGGTWARRKTASDETSILSPTSSSSLDDDEMRVEAQPQTAWSSPTAISLSFTDDPAQTAPLPGDGFGQHRSGRTNS